MSFVLIFVVNYGIFIVGLKNLNLKYLMRNSITCYTVAFCILLAILGVPESHTNSTGAPVGFSGSISDDQNTCQSCHSLASEEVFITSQVIISSELDDGDHYTLGESYYIAITANSFGVSKFGFQACMENEFGEKVGTLVLSESTHTQLIADGDYITHTNIGTTGSGVKTWIFNWIAPTSQQGDVTLHASVLFSNANGLATGDAVEYSSLTFTEPNFGCTLAAAFNYNDENDIEDGSCLFSLNSDVLSLSYQSLNSVGAEGEELIVNINVHNNSDEDLIIHSQRNILNLPSPINWFCWGVCYTPFVSQSTYNMEIASGSYVDEFSGHMFAGSTPGIYPIEYCFYPEGAIEDSICATVNYTVLGDVYGCLNPNAINFNSLANVTDSSCIEFPDPLWEFSESYGQTHTVAINSDASIFINNSEISIGDWIGVFYTSENGLVCAGYTEWLDVNTNINILGFDPESNQGFLETEEFIWQVWDASEGVSWPMEVEYSLVQPNQGMFQSDGFSSIISMVNINPVTEQIFNLPNGWSLLSTYISSSDMSVDVFLGSINDNLIIVKNNSGEAYIVEYEFNAIGPILPGQGYLLKTTAPVEFTINGEYLKPELYPIYLEQGWNMIGYLLTEPKDAELVFEELITQNYIHIVKDYSGNALIPEWGFNGIGFMNPGKGYQVKTSQETTLQY